MFPFTLVLCPTWDLNLFHFQPLPFTQINHCPQQICTTLFLFVNLGTLPHYLLYIIFFFDYFTPDIFIRVLIVKTWYLHTQNHTYLSMHIGMTLSHFKHSDQCFVIRSRSWFKEQTPQSHFNHAVLQTYVREKNRER